jgi:hypothetical protein
MPSRIATILFLLCVACSVWADTPPDQAEAIEQLKGVPSNLQKNRDGTVRFVRFSKAIVTDEHVAKTAAFQQLDYLAVVTPNVTDAGLAHVGQLTNLDTLFLSDSSVTDATISRLAPLQKLERLYLDRTKVTDEGLQNIAALAVLTTLSLAETQVSDTGLSHLLKLENLDTLILSDTKVTGESVGLFSELPKLRVLSLDGITINAKQISKLAASQSLETLSLRRVSGITPDGLAGLSKSKQLKRLDVRGTKLSAADVAKLRTLNPKLNVAVDPTEAESQNALHRYLAGQPLRSVNASAAVAVVSNKPMALLVVERADERFASEAAVPDFQRHVVPLLGRLGCNGRTCHGSFQGKGGFNLSMFGYNFAADLAALTDGEEPRANPANVDASLILNKPASDDDHGGGQRFEKGGWEYQLLKNWITRGAKGIEGTPSKLTAFEVTPAEVVFEKTGDSIQLKCVAVWEDGSREDVTPLARFQTHDDTVADVSDDGLITCKSPGDTYVVAFYDNGIFSTQVMMPVSDRTGERYPEVAATTEIDRLVVSKLSKLGIVPSAVCSDEQFLRRVSLDLVGTLPSPAELTAFLGDSSPDKRQSKIDELLATEAYATWWAVRLADLTGSNSQALGSTDMNSPASDQWNAWIQRRLKDNVGWDRIAAGIILATSRRPDQTYDSYAAEQSMHMKSKAATDFTSLDNPMHYYWFRSNNQTDTDRALTFGYTFMGVRLQCAQCHKHPFDQWSKDDFEKFAGFFKRIRTGVAYDGSVPQTALKTKLGVPKKLDTAALRRQMYLRVSAEGLPIPWNEVFVDPPTDKLWPARILGGDDFDLNDFADPREPLFAWLVQADNAYFGPAFVNRIWAHYFGRGIVDAPDDFNMANPPSNKALLAWLSDQFIDRGYDIKWLHRTIASSDTYQRSCIVTQTNRTDERNFSHSIVRRMPAEVTIDAILRATARDDIASKYLNDMKGRKTGQHPRSFQARGIDYSLLVFGKPRRTTSCDCERQDSPTLLQSLYVRNDAEMIGWLERSDGWLMSVARELKQPLSSELKMPATVAQTDVGKQFADDDKTAELIKTAYQRTLTRQPTEHELETSLAHITNCENTSEGLRDIIWALLNTQEFLTNH